MTEDPLLQLLRLAPEHAMALHLALGDPATCALAALPFQTAEGTARFVDNRLRAARQGTCVPGVLDTGGGFVGYAALNLAGLNGDRDSQICAAAAELSFAIAPAWRGVGLGKHACSLLIDLAHSVKGLRRVSARCLNRNAAAAAVLQSCGLVARPKIEGGLCYFDRAL